MKHFSRRTSGMNRRQWLKAAAGIAGISTLSWDNPRPNRSLMEMTPSDSPLITGSHVGFRPDSLPRLLISRGNSGQDTQLTVAGPDGHVRSFPVAGNKGSGFANRASGITLAGLKGPGVYRASLVNSYAPAGHPFSFTIADDVWSRVLPLLAGYAHHQRCGHSDRTVHQTCHLDDGRRRDTGAHVDVTGGWHDAGDLRKWVDATLMNLFGLTALARNLTSHPQSGPLCFQSLLDEARFGNAFFLKMQDADGLIWADVGGGVHGDNSDNHWTDNKTGTGDDRWINVEKRPVIQSMFTAAQAMMYRLFAKSDPDYAGVCLHAALHCWKASTAEGTATTDLAWRTLAAAELFTATGDGELRQQVIALANRLKALQVISPAGAGSTVRGFFPMWAGNQQPLRDAVHSAIPLVALLHAARSIAISIPRQAEEWNRAVRLYLDEYATPMAALSPYNVVPFGLFLDNPALQVDAESYRTLSPRYRYRFFMPVSAGATFMGLSSHLLSHATLFAAAGLSFGETKYLNLAWSHLEWVFGANPFGTSLVTGVGINQPPVFSPFVGLIPGGIMNGIAGNEDDQPVLNRSNPEEWRTNEYWSPHSGYCLWALSLLESRRVDSRLA